MPANRSRTSGWRRCLHQIFERNGSLEIAIARYYGEDDRGQHLIWRVRLLDLSETDVIVEQPMTLGQLIRVDKGVEMVAIIAIGQNRWMFPTTNLGPFEHRLNDSKTVPAMRLVLPNQVERCQRRNFYRVETAALILPKVEVWPLLDPKSVVIAELANELQSEMPATDNPHAGEKFLADDVMPEIGPKFSASLVNIGGGGVGLNVEPDQSSFLGSHKMFWIRISLPPELETPIYATGKLVHTHLESNHSVYAGMSFDFSFNPSHQRFVADQICKYIAVQQRSQLKREAEREEERKSA